MFRFITLLFVLAIAAAMTTIACADTTHLNANGHTAQLLTLATMAAMAIYAVIVAAIITK